MAAVWLPGLWESSHADKKYVPKKLKGVELQDWIAREPLNPSMKPGTNGPPNDNTKRKSRNGKGQPIAKPGPIKKVIEVVKDKIVGHYEPPPKSGQSAPVTAPDRTPQPVTTAQPAPGPTPPPAQRSVSEQGNNGKDQSQNPGSDGSISKTPAQTDQKRASMIAQISSSGLPPAQIQQMVQLLLKQWAEEDASREQLDRHDNSSANPQPAAATAQEALPMISLDPQVQQLVPKEEREPLSEAVSTPKPTTSKTGSGLAASRWAVAEELETEASQSAGSARTGSEIDTSEPKQSAVDEPVAEPIPLSKALDAEAVPLLCIPSFSAIRQDAQLPDTTGAPIADVQLSKNPNLNRGAHDLERSDRPDVLVQRLRAEIQQRDISLNDLVQERDRANRDVDELTKKLNAQLVKHSALLAERRCAGENGDQAEKSLDEQDTLVHQLRKDLQEQEQKADALEEQMYKYKQLYISSLHRPGQKSDATIAQSVGGIWFHLNGLARQLHKSLKYYEFDMINLPEATKAWTNNYVSLSTTIPPVHLRPYILACIFSKTLVEAFKAHYHFGAPIASPIQAAMTLVKSLRPERDLENRRLLEKIRRLISDKDLSILPRAERKHVEDMVASAKQDLGDTVKAELWTKETDELLGKIFYQVVKLYQTLHRQEARYFVDMAPASNWAFSPAQMEDVMDPGEGSETVKGSAIEVSVFPSVYKKGDEFGENMLLTTVVCKAKVVVKKENEE